MRKQAQIRNANAGYTIADRVWRDPFMLLAISTSVSALAVKVWSYCA